MTIKATTENVVGLTATKLTGAFPVLDASALTGISVGPQSGASDPTVSTNPSGVGIVYQNTTSGETFICTAATAGANVWLNVGTGAGQVAKPFGGLGGGTLNGYSQGGEIGPSPAVRYSTIEKFSFSSDGNATDHGDLRATRFHVAGASSSTDGYAAGGSAAPAPFTQYDATIDKYSFSSNVTATAHGTLTRGRYGQSGLHSSTHGFVAGGYGTPPNGTKLNIIDKFAFSSNVSGTDHGDLMTTSSYRSNNGACSNTHGFLIGGVEGAGSTTIEKFPFASATGSVDSGQDLTISNSQMTCASSTTHGYSVGGYAAGTYTTKIDKWAFATSNNAVDVGDLVVPVSVSGGHSSTTHGYKSGGSNHTLSPANQDHIEKFSFSTDANASNVGDLPTRRRYVTGCHN